MDAPFSFRASTPANSLLRIWGQLVKYFHGDLDTKLCSDGRPAFELLREGAEVL